MRKENKRREVEEVYDSIGEPFIQNCKAPLNQIENSKKVNGQKYK